VKPDPRSPGSQELSTEARFPAIPLDKGHYESFYLKACHPEQPLGIWIRYTVHKRPGREPLGSVWFTLFDAAGQGPRASKTTLEAGGLSAGDGLYIRLGESRFEPGHVAGQAKTEQLDARWELSYSAEQEALFHLPSWMYGAPVPRTKLLTPCPYALFDGRVQVGDREVALERWPGMIGHNWGSQHAERWIWLYGASFEGADQSWLDAAIGRVRLGPLTLPWIANGTLHLDGTRYRLGGVERVRKTKVRESPTGCDFELPGAKATVSGRVESEPKNFVGWVYADPDGSEHNTLNCSISDMTLSVSRPGQAPRELRLRGGAAYELGMRETDHGIPIQPFPDG